MRVDIISAMRVRSIASGILLLTVASCRPAASPAETGRVAVGQQAPAFNLPRVDGKGRVGVPDGKVMLVAFWALEWGGQHELPKLEDLHRRFADRGLEVVVVSHDMEGVYLPQVVQRYGITFAMVWDDCQKIIKRWRPDNIMSVYLLDRDGVVRLVRSAGKESSPCAAPGVESAIEELLGPPGAP